MHPVLPTHLSLFVSLPESANLSNRGEDHPIHRFSKGRRRRLLVTSDHESCKRRLLETRQDERTHNVIMDSPWLIVHPRLQYTSLNHPRYMTIRPVTFRLLLFLSLS